MPRRRQKTLKKRKKIRKRMRRPSELTERERVERVIKRIRQRVVRAPIQTGGGFSSSGSIGNMVNQVFGFVENIVEATVLGVETVFDAIELPGDLYYHTTKSAEPTTDNTSAP